MKLTLNSFYAIHIFTGVYNQFLRLNADGSVNITFDASKATRFASIVDAEKFMICNEAAALYIDSHKDCADIFIAEIKVVANVKTCKRIS